MSRTLRNRAAIAGIGQTEFSKASGRSELQLACEAAKAALDDAGLLAARRRRPGHLHDGFQRGSRGRAQSRHPGADDVHARPVRRRRRLRASSCRRRWRSRPAPPTSCVCYRAFNERSGMRFGGAAHGRRRPLPPFLDMYGPYGLLTPASWVALQARRYMHEYGVTNEHFGRISVVDRTHAANNPAAWFYQRPITLGGPSGLALDRRAGAAAARLLPGERRRRRAGRDHARARARSAPARRR